MSNACENRYKLRREIAGLTQEDAAELLPVSTRSLSDYETGKTVPSDDVVDRMAEVYNAPMLAYEHVRDTNVLGKYLPEIVMPENNGDMAFQLVISHDELDVVVKSMKKIFSNGKVDDDEWPDYISNIEITDRVAGKLLSAVAFARQHLKERKEDGGDRMGDSRFYFARDIMQMMECKENKAYKIIRQLNAELQAKGFLTYDGRVPKTYFEQRYGLTAVPTKKGA